MCERRGILSCPLVYVIRIDFVTNIETGKGKGVGAASGTNQTLDTGLGGPLSTLCGHSHQISAPANRFLEREAGEFNNPVDARVVLTGLALIVGLGAYSSVPT